MRQETSNRTTRGRGIGALAVATLASAVALTVAGPASARNDFQNGFEDQLGRIAAHAAVDVGLQILHGGYYPVVPVAPPVYYAPSYGYGYGYGHHYDGPRNVVVKYPKHRRHYRHDRHYRPDHHYRGYDDRGAHHYNQRKHPGTRYDQHYGKRHDGYRNDDRDHRSRGGEHGDRGGRNW